MINSWLPSIMAFKPSTQQFDLSCDRQNCTSQPPGWSFWSFLDFRKLQVVSQPFPQTIFPATPPFSHGAHHCPPRCVSSWKAWSQRGVDFTGNFGPPNDGFLGETAWDFPRKIMGFKVRRIPILAILVSWYKHGTQTFWGIDFMLDKLEMMRTESSILWIRCLTYSWLWDWHWIALNLMSTLD